MNCIKCHKASSYTLAIFDPTRNFSEMYTFIYGLCEHDAEVFVRRLNQLDSKEIFRINQTSRDKRILYEKKQRLKLLCKICHNHIPEEKWYVQVLNKFNKIMVFGNIDKYCIKTIMIELNIIKKPMLQTSFDDLLD